MYIGVKGVFKINLDLVGQKWKDRELILKEGSFAWPWSRSGGTDVGKTSEWNPK